jgi:hypothetical protein
MIWVPEYLLFDLYRVRQSRKPDRFFGCEMMLEGHLHRSACVEQEFCRCGAVR